MTKHHLQRGYPGCKVAVAWGSDTDLADCTPHRNIHQAPLCCKMHQQPDTAGQVKQVVMPTVVKAILGSPVHALLLTAASVNSSRQKLGDAGCNRRALSPMEILLDRRSAFDKPQCGVVSVYCSSAVLLG